MKRALVPFIAVFCCSCASAVAAVDYIRAIEDALNQSARLRILHISDNSTTRVRVKPEMLESWAEFRRDVSKVDNPRVFTDLAEALGKTSVFDNSELPDLRWGCLIYSKDGRRLGAVYLGRKYINRTEVSGVFNRRTVKVNGALLRWFERSLPQSSPALAEAREK